MPEKTQVREGQSLSSAGCTQRRLDIVLTLGHRSQALLSSHQAAPSGDKAIALGGHAGLGAAGGSSSSSWVSCAAAPMLGTTALSSALPGLLVPIIWCCCVGPGQGQEQLLSLCSCKHHTDVLPKWLFWLCCFPLHPPLASDRCVIRSISNESKGSINVSL